MNGRTHAKVNLMLRVRARRDDGLHSLVSLAQSVGWSDEMRVERADEDALVVSGADLPERPSNLAWRAVEAVRSGPRPFLRMDLVKQIPVAAGLGGGSADAALGLALAVGVLGRSVDQAVDAAPRLGADVPFSLAGGTAWMEGVGDRLTRIETPHDFWLGVAVPPFELSTADVYRRWDELDGPADRGAGGRDLPVSLREHGPLGNDLRAAAVDLEPALGDWVSDLGALWGRQVLMSGSGPSLFGFFPSESEARDAVATVIGARATRTCAPLGVGWEIEDPGPLPPAPWI